MVRTHEGDALGGASICVLWHEGEREHRAVNHLGFRKDDGIDKGGDVSRQRDGFILGGGSGGSRVHVDEASGDTNRQERRCSGVVG